MERNTLIAKISEYLECTMDTADLYLMLLEKPYTLDTMMVLSLIHIWQRGICGVARPAGKPPGERLGGRRRVWGENPDYLEEYLRYGGRRFRDCRHLVPGP